MKKVDKLLEQAEALCRAEILKQVQVILAKNPKIAVFRMAMGIYHFADSTNEIVEPRGTKKLDDLISKYDNILHLTGNPMKVVQGTGEVKW